MIWVQMDGWDPDIIEAVQARHDLDAGVLVVPARPHTRTVTGALRDTLSGLGKDLREAARDAPAAVELVTEAWLHAEEIDTAVVLSANRWRVEILRGFERYMARTGIQTVAVATDPVSRRYATAVAEFSEPGETEAAVVEPRPSARRAPSPGPYAPLRGCRLPHTAVAGTAHHLGWDAKALCRLELDDYDFNGDLRLPTGRLPVPEPLRRFVAAQQYLSWFMAAKYLLTKWGRPLEPGEFTWAHFVLERDGYLPKCGTCPMQAVVGPETSTGPYQKRGAEDDALW